MELLVETAQGPHYPAIVQLRYQVLRAPLGIARADMNLTHDADCLYVIAVDAGQVVGCVALEGARLRQMAIAPARQHQGIGRQLVVRLEEEARARGLRRIELHARETARGFYAKLGYVPEGDTFTEVGIPHVLMVKTLPLG